MYILYVIVSNHGDRCGQLKVTSRVGPGFHADFKIMVVITITNRLTFDRRCAMLLTILTNVASFCCERVDCQTKQMRPLQVFLRKFSELSMVSVKFCRLRSSVVFRNAFRVPWMQQPDSALMSGYCDT